MRISIVTPAARIARHGNRVTALRWALFLRRLGHAVELRAAGGAPVRGELLIALHAEHTAAAVRAFRSAWPERPVIVAVTGTDVYREGGPSPEARATLALATRIVLLQPRALRALPEELRPRARVVLQSASVPRAAGAPEPGPEGELRVVSLAHLRPVKDPLLGARAAALLPPGSGVRIELIGAALDPGLAARATAASAASPRWHRVGPLPRREALERLTGAQLALSTSRSEGGASFLSEALAAGVPPLASDAEGNLGLLGEDWPGRFPAGDPAALAELLARCERDPAFRAELARAARARAASVRPEAECAAWRELLAELP